MMPFKQILAPIDFSAQSARGLAQARAMATACGARLDVLHVVEEPTFPAMYSATMHELYGAVPDLNRQALAALDDLLEEAGGKDVETGMHVVRGRAADEIVRFAEEHGTDLVVLPSRGLTGLEHWVLGSTAEKVVRRAPCSVLVVKPLPE
ncbi:MAG: universal stress protein [Rhodothermales bacterium]|nr:universal stress protein [Rhodothermales bacterium]